MIRREGTRIPKRNETKAKKAGEHFVEHLSDASPLPLWFFSTSFTTAAISSIASLLLLLSNIPLMLASSSPSQCYSSLLDHHLRPRLARLPSSRLPIPPPAASHSDYTRSIKGRGGAAVRVPIAKASSFSPPSISRPDEWMTLAAGLDVVVLEEEMERFVEVANKTADAAGEVLRKYFRQNFEILDKDDLSPVTIADREAEESMISIILENFPDHAVFGEENGWRCKHKCSDYVWVLDPIDGTKSFITGKPLFGTLIALLHMGKPVLGIIDQPVLRERWIGAEGRRTVLNGREVSTRACSDLSKAYLYTTSPHLFEGDAEKAFSRVRDKVKVPLYGCDCYAYALLASGFVDLVIESGLKPYDFLSLIPVIEGAGGSITDWKGQKLHWIASPESHPTSFNVAAAGDRQVHKQTIDELKLQ